MFRLTGRLVRRKHTTAKGRFSFELPAGRYTLVARTDHLRWKRRARVRPGQTTRATITIPIP